MWAYCENLSSIGCLTKQNRVTPSPGPLELDFGLGLGLWQCNNIQVEHNLVFYFSYHNISIYEPCNYASNLAYYHVVTSICAYQDWSISDQYRLAMAQAFTCNGCLKKHSKNFKIQVKFRSVFLRHLVNIAKYLLRPYPLKLCKHYSRPE